MGKQCWDLGNTIRTVVFGRIRFDPYHRGAAFHDEKLGGVVVALRDDIGARVYHHSGHG
jgi:hypothetical protein